MEKVKIALVGCGYFGRMHAQIYVESSAAELVGVCDANAETAGAVATQCGSRPFTHLEEMLDTVQPDALDICLPDPLHAEAVFAAMDRNLHLFVEKPLADSMTDSLAIMERAGNYAPKATVGYISRFDSRFMAAYEAIRAGQIGDMLYMSSKRVSPIEGGLHYAPLCRLTTHSGVHDIDLARWFAGCEYCSVFSKGVKKRLLSEGYDVEDAVLSVFTFENGVIYSHENAWSLPAGYPAYIEARFDIVGTKGMLQIDMGHHGLMMYNETRGQYPDLYHWPELMGKRSGALKAELDHFMDCVLYDQTPLITLTDGYRVTQAARAVIRSIEEKIEIKITTEG